MINNIQLSPEEEVNSGESIRDTKRRGIYLALFTDAEGDSSFSIYQISWIKMKEVTFQELYFKQLTNISGILSVALFTSLLQIRNENNFLPTSKHRQAEVRRFLGICLYNCLIYRSNFIFQKFLDTRRHLGFGRKTVNSQGYSELVKSNQWSIINAAF